jgi:hypothetical protein
MPLLTYVLRNLSDNDGNSAVAMGSKIRAEREALVQPNNNKQSAKISRVANSNIDNNKGVK